MQTMSTEPRFHKNLQQSDISVPVPFCRPDNSRTNWMGPLGTSVDAEEWNGYKSTISPQPEDSVTQLQGSLEFFGIVLVKVYVCRSMSVKYELVGVQPTDESAIPCQECEV